jgi:hypothetical protein
MKTETKWLSRAEVLRIFGLYIGCKAECVTVFRPNSNSIDVDGHLKMSAHIMSDIDDGTFPHDHFKLLLRDPHTQMTYSDSLHLIMCGLNQRGVKYTDLMVDLVTSEAIHWHYTSEDDTVINERTRWDELTSLQVQHLFSAGYDMPIFLTVGHPQNGLTAIQMGVAKYLETKEYGK